MSGIPVATLPQFAVGADYSTRRVHIALMFRDGVKAERVVDLPKNRPAAEFADLRFALAGLHAETGVTVIGFEEPFVRIRTSDEGDDQTNHRTAIALQRTATFIECAALAEGFERIYRLSGTVWRPIAGVKGYDENGRSSQKRVDLKRAAVDLVRVKYGHVCSDDNVAEAVLIGDATLSLARRAMQVEAVSA